MKKFELKDKLSIFYAIFLFFLFARIYLPVFLSDEIIGGDWPYYYYEMLSDFQIFAPLWLSQNGIGYGGISGNFPFFSYFNLVVGIFVNFLHLPWSIVYKIFFFGLPFYIGAVGIYKLLFYFYGKSNFILFSTSFLIYFTNTYFLMIYGGGQVGIVLAYSIMPLVFATFVRVIDAFPIDIKNKANNQNFKLNNIFKNVNLLMNAIIFGVIFAIQIVFDVRISYVTAMILVLYTLFSYYLVNKFNLKLFVIFSLAPIFVILGLHFYWIFPFVFFRLSAISRGLLSVSGFEFFSFADFSHSISLLHPNWPENIFGKTYFLRSEFLILPIISFFSLVLIRFKEITNLKNFAQLKYYVIFFVTLGLIGPFFSKGSNDPLGLLNLWIFEHIPGMNMFRDPTKFYIVTVFSYAFLVPASLEFFSSFLMRFKFANIRFNSINIFFLISFLFVISWALLIRDGIFGRMGGIFDSRDVTKEYTELAELISTQPDFYRTLWVPTQSRFRYQTETHPLVNADSLFNSSSISAILGKMEEKNVRELLSNLSIKYVIVPADTTSEIFLTDRKYDQTKREEVEKRLDKINWLKKIQDGPITIYQTHEYKNHFWLVSGKELNYKRITSSEYKINYNGFGDLLVFSESYDSLWKAEINKAIVDSDRFNDRFNSFKLPKGSYEITIFFKPQEYIKYSYLFSFISLFFVVSLWVFVNRKINSY